MIKSRSFRIFLYFLACKETAFSHAVISAGIAYAVTESCYQGEIRNCQCDNGLKRSPWDGCSADVKFGVKISGQLMDGAETSHSFHSEINIYNNRVGRLVSPNSPFRWLPPGPKSVA